MTAREEYRIQLTVKRKRATTRRGRRRKSDILRVKRSHFQGVCLSFSSLSPSTFCNRKPKPRNTKEGEVKKIFFPSFHFCLQNFNQVQLILTGLNSTQNLTLTPIKYYLIFIRVCSHFQTRDQSCKQIKSFTNKAHSTSFILCSISLVYPLFELLQTIFLSSINFLAYSNIVRKHNQTLENKL